MSRNTRGCVFHSFMPATGLGQKMPPLQTFGRQLALILLQVQMHRRQVVLLSPLPHKRAPEQQAVQLATYLCRQQARDWQVPLFDVAQCLTGGDELFQPHADDRLSAVAHELLGSDLHTFITEPSYV